MKKEVKNTKNKDMKIGNLSNVVKVKRTIIKATTKKK